MTASPNPRCRHPGTTSPQKTPSPEPRANPASHHFTHHARPDETPARAPEPGLRRVEERLGDAGDVGVGDPLGVPARGCRPDAVAAGQPFAEFGHGANADARVRAVQPARSDSGSGAGVMAGRGCGRAGFVLRPR